MLVSVVGTPSIIGVVSATPFGTDLDHLQSLREVSESMAAQATLWQPASRYSVRVEKAVEASVVKLNGDLPGLLKMLLARARLGRGDNRSCLLLGEDLTPPIGVRGRDTSTAAEALAGRDVPFCYPSRQVVHHLGARPATLPHPLPCPCHLESTLP
jgi:hypothetical protein